MKASKFLLFILLPLGMQAAFSQVPQSTVAASAPTVVPPLIPFSGMIESAPGERLPNDVTVTFQIFKDQLGGNPLFVESQRLEIDTGGHYSAQLGATLANGIPIDLFANGEARWLEIEVAGQPAQSRILLVSVPYALKAADAATLGGLPASAYALAGSTTASGIGKAEAATVSPDAAAAVTTPGGGSGYLSLFTGVSTVADSIVFQNTLGIGIGDLPNGMLDVNGKSIFRGPLQVARIGNATTAAGVNSNPFAFFAQAYDSSTKANVGPFFELQAEPTGNNTATPGATLHLLYDNGAEATPPETGLYINSNGTINFAPGQTLPAGAGTITGVNSGTGLRGGGTTGSVTLDIDTTKVPLLATANHFNASLSSTGQFISTIPTGTAPLAVSSTTVVPNLNASFLGGLSASAVASLAASNNFTGEQTFSEVGIGTTTPRSALEISTPAAQGLGPVFTLTNTAGQSGAEDALDFNTILPSATGTYNPMARIAAQDVSGYSDSLVFQSNSESYNNALNQGLQTNMIIQSNGLVGINSTVPGAQLEIDADPFLYVSALAAYGGSGPGGSFAGAGGIFTGGVAQHDSGCGCAGTGGDGIQAYFGGSDGGTSGYAGYFGGDVSISGTLSAGAKNFEIDHPLDPANKYLDHASVESSEMVNIYSGNVITDELGIATVHLPDWFEAENGDFRYQLTTIGRDAHAWISEEVADKQFQISTNASRVKVSWQITGVRQDAFAKAHPLIVEREKLGRERGFYKNPELYGQPAEKQTQWSRHPETMRSIRAARARQEAASVDMKNH